MRHKRRILKTKVALKNICFSLVGKLYTHSKVCKIDVVIGLAGYLLADAYH